MKIRFTKISESTPKEDQWCFIQQKIKGGPGYYIHFLARKWCADFIKNPQNYAYYIKPDHVIDNPLGWMSKIKKASGWS